MAPAARHGSDVGQEDGLPALRTARLCSTDSYPETVNVTHLWTVAVCCYFYATLASIVESLPILRPTYKKTAFPL